MMRFTSSMQVRSSPLPLFTHLFGGWPAKAKNPPHPGLHHWSKGKIDRRITSDPARAGRAGLGAHAGARAPLAHRRQLSPNGYRSAHCQARVRRTPGPAHQNADPNGSLSRQIDEVHQYNLRPSTAMGGLTDDELLASPARERAATVGNDFSMRSASVRSAKSKVQMASARRNCSSAKLRWLCARYRSAI
jgi:hypothetical protein